LSRKSNKSLSAEQLKRENPEVTDRRSGPDGGLRWMSFGIEMAGVMAIFTYGGYLADSYFGARPWFMIVGASMSFVGMTYQLFKETKKWRQ
jgi:F0F1-type ATP synthase assembly protein I